MVSSSAYIYGANFIATFRWESGFLRGFHGTPRAPTGTAEANQAVWFIRRNLQRCPTSVKQQMYFALVRPILDYASVVCDQHTTSDIQRLEMIQRRAARFVTKEPKAL